MLSNSNWPEQSGTGYWPGASGLRPSRTPGLVERVSGGAASALVVLMCTPLVWLSRESVRRFLLAAAILNLALPIGIHLGYREEMANLGALGGVGITVTTLALAGLYLPRLIATRNSGGAMRLSRASLPLALYLLFSVLSLTNASDVVLGLYEVTLVSEIFLLHFYIVNSTNSREGVLLIVKYLLFGLVAQGLLMIALAGGLAELGFLNAQTIVEEENVKAVTRQATILGLKARIDERENGLSRVGGSLGSPNDAADYLTVAIGIALGVPLTSLGRRYKMLAGVAICAGSAALVLTFSRGGWIAFLVTLGIVGYFGLRNTLIGWKRPLGVALLLFLVVGFVFSDSIAARLTEDDNGSAHSRVPLMKMAALIIADHPLLGAGANNFPIAMEPYISRGFAGEFIFSVHNKYLLVLSETGPGGLVAFVWFLLSMIRRGTRCWRYKDPLLSPLALACVAAIAGAMLHMSVDIFRGDPIMQLLCVVSALIAALERLAVSPRIYGGGVALAASERPRGGGETQGWFSRN